MDVRGPCTPRNFRSHTSTGPRPVVLKLGSGGTARLESPKGICFSLKNKKTGTTGETIWGFQEGGTSSFRLFLLAARCCPGRTTTQAQLPRRRWNRPPNPTPFFSSSSGLEAGQGEGGGAPSHTDFVMRTQLIESPPMPPNLHCPQSRASPLPATARPSQYNQSPYTGRRRQSHGQTDRQTRDKHRAEHTQSRDVPAAPPQVSQSLGKEGGLSE